MGAQYRPAATEQGPRLQSSWCAIRTLIPAGRGELPAKPKPTDRQKAAVEALKKARCPKASWRSWDFPRGAG